MRMLARIIGLMDPTGDWWKYLKRWTTTVKFLRTLFIKRCHILVVLLAMLLGSYWPRPWEISFKWIIIVSVFHVMAITAEYVYLHESTKYQVDQWLKVAAATPMQPSIGSEIVPRSHMLTFFFKAGVNVSDLSTIQNIFYSFAESYGLKKLPTKKNRQSLKNQIDKMVQSAGFITQVNSKMQDYNITLDNFEEVVNDMTLLMQPYCTDQSFAQFRGMIAAAVNRGLKLCSTHVFEDDINVLSVTEDHFFLIAFSLKIYRTETGWIVRTPVITGKYASFLLRVSTAEFMKAINIDVDKVETSGTTVILD